MAKTYLDYERVGPSYDFLTDDAVLFQAERIFGKASSLPIYEVPIRFPKKKKADPFRVMLVQTALPKMTDFDAHGASLHDAAYRRRHRRHLASVLKLVTQTIETRATHIDPRGVDLIVFPELAIHSADMDLMQLLISKTRAWVFCGLVFEAIPHSGAVVNRGAWLIPTFRSDGVRLSRKIVRFDQGKHHLIPWERANGIPYFARDRGMCLIKHLCGRNQLVSAEAIKVSIFPIGQPSDRRRLSGHRAAVQRLRDVVRWVDVVPWC
ncbi:MAG: hypothetical protein JWM57_1260 [Phycisphaerales bacterium]|nr:hypothetical protein [Phycisphaerales bacterium]